MASIIENLNEVISTKNEIKGILRDNGIDPGDVFSDYPNMIRSIVGGGSVSGDTVNSYISAYLDSYNFIDQNELSANSYVTSDVLSDYTTYNYVDGQLENCVTKTELSAQSYATTTDLSNYLPYLGVLQAHYTNSEHFLPKVNNTYYLGNSNFRWQLVYTYNIYTSNLYCGNIVLSDTYNSIVNASNTRINFQINQNNRFKMTNVEFAPVSNNGVNLGTSTEHFNRAYISNLYTDTAYSTRYNFTYNTWVGSDSDYEFHIGVNNQKRFQMNMYQFYAVTNPDNSSLGVPNYPWAYTYTKFLIGQNANISNSAYLPVNTYWYDGTTYHWLGSLFN